ncbi:MAG: threonine synthase [Candidatus Omnitrophota bacterium]
MHGQYRGLIHKYREYLPVSDKTPIVTLQEGNTPLIFAPNVSKLVGANVEVYLKYEGVNPTGSFKDRGMTLAISKAREAGSCAVMCASTGNTSASAAAYSACCGLKCIVLIPEGSIALGKLAQALIHGAEVLAVEGNFDQALELVRQITEKYQVTLVNSLNPFRIQGQKTGAFEICDYLEQSPDFLAIPVGNAGNITAYWQGFKEYYEKSLIKKLPRMLGFQAAGSAPIVRGEVVPDPKTIATAIKIGNPASWRQAEAARDDSGGLIDLVSDEEILDAYKILARQEGIFVEPASAASIAGIIKLSHAGFFKKLGKIKIACILTGHGLKDPDRAIKCIQAPKIIPPTLEAVLEETGIK